MLLLFYFIYSYEKIAFPKSMNQRKSNKQIKACTMLLNTNTLYYKPHTHIH